MPPETAAHFAFYVSGELGVLAPRGWHCLNLYGANGSTLIVTPEPRGSADLRDLAGPVVQLSRSYGGTSGRFTVARAIARFFPEHMAFARQVAAEGVDVPLPTAPYPHDRMRRVSAHVVTFITPARRRGLGTDSRLAPGRDPIVGAVILERLDEPNLLHISVRLPRREAALAPHIVNLMISSLGSAMRPVH